MGARVFSIPASTPFLPTLTEALLDGRLVPGFAPRNDRLALASATIFLPTRRAARALGHAILDALGTDAALLPRIVPLGDVDEEALAFAEESAAIGLPPAIAAAERRLVLAQLIFKFADTLPPSTADRLPLVATSPGAAIALADQLARLFDDLTIAGRGIEQLERMVLPEHDEYWRLSYDFLRIAHAAWTRHLAEHNRMDAAARRDALLARQAEQLRRDTAAPVIAAGSTGTLPAVARLLAVIARRPNGAVVLPGLDQVLDADAFDLIDGGEREGREVEPSPSHPQFGMKRLLSALGVGRDDVVALAAAGNPARERLMAEAFRPAATTERWAAASEIDFSDAFQSVSVIEAPDPRTEALAIAVCLREAMEQPGLRAALVTPDRALARRVGAELLRWGIEIEDSAGVPLAETEAGRFARLVAAAAAERLAPVPLLAVLRHSLAKHEASAAAIDHLELAVLRGPRPAPAEGLIGAVEDARTTPFHGRDPRRQLTPGDWDKALDLARRVVARFEPLLSLAAAPRAPLARLIEAHHAVLAALGFELAASAREDARKVAETLDELAQAASAPELSLGDYAASLDALFADATWRPPIDPNARIRILGTLEARLLDVERLVVGGMNEGSWPREALNDAWLNRPMRKALGLDLPERRIGLLAHDFTQAAGARELVLSRARRQAGAETVASRFWQRVRAVAPAPLWQEASDRGQAYVELARALEQAPRAASIERPAPTPPLAARPTRLSVTEIETLVRDPYSIYARHVLRLEPLEEIDAEPDAAVRGTLLHAALADFLAAHPQRLPANAVEDLLALGRQRFAKFREFPTVMAVWWPRFERLAHWFVRAEAERRDAIRQLWSEQDGKLEFDIAGQPFTLRARADRIELHDDGSVVIVDYKTGKAPGIKEAVAGLAPQLPLEAAIVRGGGFAGIPAPSRIADIQVMRLSGGEPAGEITSLHPIEAKRPTKDLLDTLGIGDCDAFAAHSLERLKALLRFFADARAPYLSVPRPKWKSRFGDYDHLARIKEWAENGGSDELW
jgi:ATP-dependent helicase/nuclease subunit B